MFVIDDSKMRLLKMKERLLEISNGADKVALEDYKKMAIEIDSEVYNKLLEKLKKSHAHSYSLEDQLIFLNEVEKDYNDLYELRCGFEFVYGKYSSNKLELSDLSNILIDNIKKRKSIVEGYLINTQNIINIKKELEKLNFMLIQAENKKDEVGRKLKQLESELKNNVLNAEGRIYSDVGSLKYTSIVQEFRDNDLDLKELLDNKELLDEEFSKINEKEVASSEKLQAAKICYQSMPTEENLDVYHVIDVDTARVRYKLVLLRIATLIYEEATNCIQALEKRMEITTLNSVRRECLHKLGINLSIDSFSRIRLVEQIDIIKSLGDNSQKIADIRKNIDMFNTLIEERIRQNHEFMLTINDNVDFVRDDTSFGNIAIENDIDISRTTSFEEYNHSNKVVNISNVPNGFMSNKVDQKTEGVIKKVNEVYNGVQINGDNLSTNPELLVVPAEEQTEDFFKTMDTNNETADLNDDVFVNADSKKEESLFSDTVPFETTPLFSDRYDDGVFAPKSDSIFVDEPTPVLPDLNVVKAEANSKSDIFIDNAEVDNSGGVSEVFWPTQEKAEMIIPTENVLSFDEQVNALINNEPGKVRKKVA